MFPTCDTNEWNGFATPTNVTGSGAVFIGLVGTVVFVREVVPGSGARNRRCALIDLDVKCHLCHFARMKTISIKELHEATGRLVREARHGTVVVTDRGVKVALLKPYSAEDVPGRAFPKRRARDLPAVGVDSTVFISSDRDER